MAFFAGGGAVGPEALSFLYVGAAFYMFVFQAFWGLLEVIQGDREWFRTITYVYISPISYYAYVAGRGAMQMMVAGFGVVFVLLFGHFVIPGVTLSVGLWSVPFLAGILLLGALVTVAIGISIAGITFFTARHGMGISEGVAGVFYIFCGVIFPLSTLPPWAQTVGRYIPLTYWFEGLRRAVLPFRIGDPFLLALPETILFLILAGSTALFFLLSLGVFHYAEYLARKKGKIDMTTAY